MSSPRSTPCQQKLRGIESSPGTKSSPVPTDAPLARRRRSDSGDKPTPSKRRKDKVAKSATASSVDANKTDVTALGPHGVASSHLVPTFGPHGSGDNEPVVIVTDQVIIVGHDTQEQEHSILLEKLAGGQIITKADIAAIFEALQVASTPTVNTLLEEAIAALSSWVESDSSVEAIVKQQQSAGHVVNILGLLPPIECKESQVNEATLLFTNDDTALNTLRSRRDTEKDERLRCQLSRELLSCITDSTTVRVAKLRSVHAVREQEEIGVQALKQLRHLRGQTKKLENESAQRTQVAASQLDIAREEHNACSVQLLELAESLTAQSESTGLGSASARLRAFNEVLRTDSSQNAVKLRQAQDNAEVKIQEQMLELRYASDELAFHTTTLKLIKAVKHCRVESDSVRQEKVNRLKASSLALAEQLSGFFGEYLPVMASSLGEVVAYYSNRRASAKAAKEAQQRKLEAHLNLFDNGKPVTQSNLEGRIRDLEEVDALSEALITDVLARQRDLWIRESELLPPRMRELVASSYRQVQQQSVGEARAVLDRFMKELEISEKPRAAAVPVAVQADEEREEEQNKSLSGCSVM